MDIYICTPLDINAILLHQTPHTLPCDTGCKHIINHTVVLALDKWARSYSAECVYSRVQSATEQQPS